MNRLRKAMTAGSGLLLALTLTGCQQKSESGSSGSAGEFSAADPVNLLTREDGSGTRSAFAELFGLEETLKDGSKTDTITPEAAVTSSTSVMLTTVADDPAAIGYVSLGSLNDTVKAVAIDGQSATAEAIQEGSYKISRPFNLVVKDDLSDAAEDFLHFILSGQGQAVVEENHYIPLEDTETWTASDAAGKVVISGSSSVAPLMEKLTEAYESAQSGVTVEVQQSDSSSGISDAADGVSDIGMASRDLKDSETEKGVKAIPVAIDGIAVIVNPANPGNSLTSDQVKEIYSGQAGTWNEILG